MDVIVEHPKALEGDLLKAGYELKDIGHSISWGALFSFVSRLETDSCLAAEMVPDIHSWSTRLKTNIILADIYDVLALINANIVAIGTHEKTKKPNFYKRPNSSDDVGDRYGEGAVPVDELRRSFAEKRRKRYVRG